MTEILKQSLEDEIFTSMINKVNSFSINETNEGLTEIDFEIKNHFYDRNPRQGIDIWFVGEAIFKLMKKYNLEGIMINESIIDH